MTDEHNQILTVYYAAVESFEYLETLLIGDKVDVIQVMRGLHICYEKVENILSEENLNSPYSVDLFQVKQHVLELRKFLDDKVEQLHLTKNIEPSIKHQSRDEAAREKQLSFVKDTIIDTPQSNGLKDIAGLWEVKKVLKSLIILPRNQPQLFVNRRACNSVLLYGPPGTGKTRLVHALAHEANANLHSVSVSDLISPLVGQTEKNVQVLFDYIGNNENFSILFIDEIDGFCRTRNGSEQDYTRRMKTELMCHMSKMEDNKNMFLICATNCPWDLDTAFLRRFQKQLYIPLPNIVERLELFQLFMKDSQLENNTDYWKNILNKTEGFSGSDISNLVTSALNTAVVELEDTKIWKATTDGYYEPVVTTEDFNVEDIMCCEVNDLPYNSVKTRPVHILDLVNALDDVSPTVPSLQIKKYEDFTRK